MIDDLLMIHDSLAHTFVSSIQSTAMSVSSSVSSQPWLRRSVPNHRPLHRNKPQDNPTVVKRDDGSNPNKLVTVRIHGLGHKASFKDSGTIFSRTINGFIFISVKMSSFFLHSVVIIELKKNRVGSIVYCKWTFIQQHRQLIPPLSPPLTPSFFSLTLPHHFLNFLHNKK